MPECSHQGICRQRSLRKVESKAFMTAFIDNLCQLPENDSRFMRNCLKWSQTDCAETLVCHPDRWINICYIISLYAWFTLIIPLSASPQFGGSATRSQRGSWRRAFQISRSLFIWGWKVTTKVRIMRCSISWWTFGWEPIESKYHYSGIKQ